MSFPVVLDDARVLYYTPQDCYGTVCYATGEVVDKINYLAICKYKNDSVYYLFGCNAAYEVVSDSLWNTVEECMCVAKNSYDCVISWIAMF